MPFSLSVKEELSKIAPSTRFAALCQIASILNFSKSLNKPNCLIYSEHIGTINFLVDYLQMEIESVFPLRLIKTNSSAYFLCAKNEQDFCVIKDMFLGEDLVKKYELVKNFQNRIVFLRGAFLACGSMNNPNKEYQLEFILNDEKKMNLLIYILDFYNFSFKATNRKNYVVLYTKDSECIEDFLTLIGATKSSLSIMQIKILKDVRNRVNRATNCETANIDKTVSASNRQIKNINYLIKVGAFEKLSDNLKKTAQIRLKNPEMSLREISDELGCACTKSCISHRLQKINQIAKLIREGKK